MALSNGQQKAYELMMAGKNVFLTGEAGTGKSFVVKKFLKDVKKPTIVCAPTGVAALNVGGVTLHRAFRLPVNGLKPDTFIKTTSAVSSARVVVIDEISMCRMDVFMAVASVLRNARKPKQVIVVGDFFQLAPVLSTKEKDFFLSTWGHVVSDGYSPKSLSEPFAFLADTWEDFAFKPVCLTEPMRQKDDADFLDALNRIRVGDSTALAWIMTHAAGERNPDSIYLCGRNDKARSVNDDRLDRISSPPKVYEAVKSGIVNKSDMPVDETITLKVGCRIMTVVNDTVNGYYVNGSLGTVKELCPDGIIVDFQNGRKNIKIVPYEWEIMDYQQTTETIHQYRTPVLDKDGNFVKDKNGKTKTSPWSDITDADEIPDEPKLPDGTDVYREITRKAYKLSPCGAFEQIPVKLAYAVTIHKSQGQTYDAVTLDPKCFGSGQLYTALSRVRKVSDLYLESPIQNYYLKTNPDVCEFYRRMEEESNKQLTLPPYTVTPDEMTEFESWWAKLLKRRQKGSMPSLFEA